MKTILGMSNVSQQYQRPPKTDDSQQYTQQSESVKIAKVQNLYERSSRIHGYEIDTSPSAEVEIVKSILKIVVLLLTKAPQVQT
ncbi:putative conjugative transfer protein TraI [Orientia tsutsugamushi str. TA763]|nr:putative conjugative transfer protein TraI [Orientia tsutsugamushi str. TA763]